MAPVVTIAVVVMQERGTIRDDGRVDLKPKTELVRGWKERRGYKNVPVEENPDKMFMKDVKLTFKNRKKQIFHPFSCGLKKCYQQVENYNFMWVHVLDYWP